MKLNCKLQCSWHKEQVLLNIFNYVHYSYFFLFLLLSRGKIALSLISNIKKKMNNGSKPHLLCIANCRMKRWQAKKMDLCRAIFFLLIFLLWKKYNINSQGIVWTSITIRHLCLQGHIFLKNIKYIYNKQKKYYFNKKNTIV